MQKKIKQKSMNCLFKNFMKLAVKQIKTYAAVVLISTLSLEATALVAEEKENPEPGMVTTFETSFIEEMSIESWMLSPFEVSIDEGTPIETLLPAPSEKVSETEVAFESWMAVPFEISVSEESPVESNICSPAP